MTNAKASCPEKEENTRNLIGLLASLPLAAMVLAAVYSSAGLIG